MMMMMMIIIIIIIISIIPTRQAEAPLGRLEHRHRASPTTSRIMIIMRMKTLMVMMSSHLIIPTRQAEAPPGRLEHRDRASPTVPGAVQLVPKQPRITVPHLKGQDRRVSGARYKKCSGGRRKILAYLTISLSSGPAVSGVMIRSRSGSVRDLL
jgi:hypothetical protein